MGKLYLYFFCTCLAYLGLKNVVYTVAPEGSEVVLIAALKFLFTLAVVALFYRSLNRMTHG